MQTGAPPPPTAPPLPQLVRPAVLGAGAASGTRLLMAALKLPLPHDARGARRLPCLVCWAVRAGSRCAGDSSSPTQKPGLNWVVRLVWGGGGGGGGLRVGALVLLTPLSTYAHKALTPRLLARALLLVLAALATCCGLSAASAWCPQCSRAPTPPSMPNSSQSLRASTDTRSVTEPGSGAGSAHLARGAADHRCGAPSWWHHARCGLAGTAAGCGSYYMKYDLYRRAVRRIVRVKPVRLAGISSAVGAAWGGRSFASTDDGCSDGKRLLMTLL